MGLETTGKVRKSIFFDTETIAEIICYSKLKEFHSENRILVGIGNNLTRGKQQIEIKQLVCILHYTYTFLLFFNFSSQNFADDTGISK